MKYFKNLLLIPMILLILIGCSKNKPPNTPVSPSGPSSGVVSEQLSFSAHTTDPNDDDIAYQFEWGDDNLSSWSSYKSSGNSATKNHIYNSAGTYEVRVKAKDIKDKESEWSPGLQVEIVVANNPPNIPQAPSGLSSGFVDSTYNFSTLTTDPDGDSVAYQFDWGDGKQSTWSNYKPSGNSVSMDHSYSSEGTYNVKSKAKDKAGNESNWSNGHLISISSMTNSPPNTPPAPSGLSNNYTDSTCTFSTSTTDPNGDSISYQFDWGDGTYSNWSNYVSSGDSVSMDHSYSSGETYYVKAKAKDEDGAESGWSSGHSITISIPNRAPNTPSKPSGISTGFVDSTYSFSTLTTDPDGDNVAYKFDWGDGTYSNWSNYVSSGNIVSMDHSYSSGGTYYVKTKAKDQDGAESGWSSEDSINIFVKSLEKWSFLTGGPILSSPAIGSDGTIYVGSEDSNLYAINPDGTQNWAFPTEGFVSSSPAIGSDGTIYVGSSDDNLYAINPNGTEEWAFSTGGDVHCSPAIGSDGTIYVGCLDRNVYAINPDGTQKWAFPTEAGVWFSSPAVGLDGTIYVGSEDHNLYAINPDGTEKWTFLAESWVEGDPAIGSDGTIYVGSSDNNLYAINPDGGEKWAFTVEDIIARSAAIGSDGTIYVGSWDNNIYAINPDGTEKWVFPTGDDVACSPAIGSDGTIYVGSADNNLYAINPDGTPKRMFSAEDDVYYSSPAIGSDGTIYVGSEDGNLYAIYGSSGGLANSPWPMFHHDIRHSGRVGGP
jgi:outer membrane protein assembly factor BamB